MPIKQEIVWGDLDEETTPQLRGTWKEYNIHIAPDTPLMTGRFRVSISRRLQPSRTPEEGGQWLGFTAEDTVRWAVRKLEKMHLQDQKEEVQFKMYIHNERQELQSAIETTRDSNE